jgi:hypothetical protein
LSNVRKPINVGEMTQTLYAHMNKRNKKICEQRKEVVG